MSDQDEPIAQDGPEIPQGAPVFQVPPAFLEWQSQLVANAVAQAMQAMPPPQVTVNTSPVPSAAPAPASSGIPFKFADPRTFSGKSEDARPFLNQIKDRLNSSLAPRMLERDKVTYLSSYLAAGAPQRWHHSVVQSRPGLLTDFNEYVKAFKEHFLDPHEATTYRRKLESLKQDKDVQRYAAVFREYAALSEVDEKTKWNCFFRGLKPEIQKALNTGSGTPATFERLVEYALSIDSTNQMIQGFNNGSHSNSNRSRPNGNGNNNSSSSSASPASGPWPMEIDAVKARLVAGRLPSGERERRRKNNLCLYCGQAGHIVSSCPVRSQKASNASQGTQKVTPSTSNSGNVLPRT